MQSSQQRCTSCSLFPNWILWEKQCTQMNASKTRFQFYTVSINYSKMIGNICATMLPNNNYKYAASCFLIVPVNMHHPASSETLVIVLRNKQWGGCSVRAEEGTNNVCLGVDGPSHWLFIKDKINLIFLPSDLFPRALSDWELTLPSSCPLNQVKRLTVAFDLSSGINYARTCVCVFYNMVTPWYLIVKYLITEVICL